MKTTRIALAVVAGLAIAPVDARAECGKVSLAQMNWASAEIIAQITQFIMAQGYGCDVTMIPSATTTAITSLAENNEPDVVQELWVNSAPAYFKLAEEGKLIKAADVISDGGSEHWLIPDYLAEEHPELTTIEGVLANPELVGGKFHNCPDGWGCRISNDSLIEAFELEAAGFEIFNHGSGETLASAMAAAYESGEPYFGYYWGPTAPLGKYNMVSVDLGPHDPEAHACNGDLDCDRVGKTSYPPAPVFTVVTADLAEREPEIFELVSNISFSNAELSNLLAWKEDNSASNEEAAVYFLSTQQSTWSQWVNDDARAKLEPIFQ
ncbi:MAG: ABC transporter substrate-binding protein [Candidatus Competibacterales bacterium]